VTTALKAVPQQELLKCFQQWQHRRAKMHSCSRGALRRWPFSV